MQVRNLFLSILSVSILVTSCNSKADEAPVSPFDALIPMPVSLKKDTGAFVLNEKTKILTDTTPAVQKLATQFAEQLKPSLGFQMEVATAGANDSNAIKLELHASEISLGKEGYNLSVSGKGVKITAADVAGLFYGLQTVRQLLPHSIESSTAAKGPWTIPATTISDKPEYAYRGSMLDVARHFFEVGDVKRYIDLISFYKMNTLHLHLSDDQGWRIEIKSWPNLTAIGGSTEVGGEKGGFYTQEQYKELVQYAADRFITIIPEIDMPGHTNAALASYPELNCNDTATKLYTGTEVGFSSLCTNKEVTYKFLDDVIREIASLTPGQYIHIGGDESHATKKEDYIPFMEKVQAIVKKHNKLAIGWDEIALSKIEPNTVAQYWADANNSTEAVKKGAKIIMSPARKIYLDMQYDSTSRIGLHWAAYIEVDSAYIWDPAILEPGIKRENILGIEAALWSETVTNMDDIEYLVFPRLPGYAEIGWSPAAQRDWKEYRVRLGNHGARMKAMQIGYYPSKKVDWKE